MFGFSQVMHLFKIMSFEDLCEDLCRKHFLFEKSSLEKKNQVCYTLLHEIIGYFFFLGTRYIKGKSGRAFSLHSVMCQKQISVIGIFYSYKSSLILCKVCKLYRYVFFVF